MSVLSGIVNCPEIQTNLDEHFTGMNPATVLEIPNYLNFLVSDMNRAGFVQVQDMVTPGDGKIRNVEVLYDCRLDETQVDETFDITCDGDRELGNTQKTYSIDPAVDGLKYFFSLDYATIRENCQENGAWFLSRLMKAINVMDRRVASKVADDTVLHIGSFVDTTDVVADVKTVQTVDASGNNTQNLIEEVAYNSENNAFNSVPWIFGWGETKKYFARVAAGCCLQTGLDLAAFSSQNDMVFSGDYRIEDAFGTNNFLVTQVGALQLITYNEFQGWKQTNDESFETVEIVSPFTGIAYDMFMSKVCTGGKIKVNVTLRVAVKVISMPSDMFCAGDRLEGVNFVNQYVINNS